MINPSDKIMPITDLPVGLKHDAWGRRVLTNGCFDMIHRGHAEYLYEASKLGDNLIVLLNSDSSIHRLKGNGRPVYNQNNRAYVLASFACVDAVIIFDSERCPNEILRIRPDVYVKGGDYCMDNIDIDEKAALMEVGARMVFIPVRTDISTSKLLEKLNG